ncbi:MAG: hypothetical protein IKC11_06335 [Clostridia bacterium]|nr:hypothetical protein [Clostridia bacterium]
MVNLSNMTEREIYQALTGIESQGFKPKILHSEGNKIAFDDVLEYFKGADFDEFFSLLDQRKDSDTESIKVYNDYVQEHPMIELLGKFIRAKFLDLDFNYKENYLISLGDELFEKEELRGLDIREGIILRDGGFLPVASKEAHRLGSIWLYVHGYRLETMVRYTSDYMKEPYFSSMVDYVDMSSNAIAFSTSQAVAMCNILTAKCRRLNFQEKFCEFTDLCLMPGADSYSMINNAMKLEDVLGKDVFDAHQVITDIRQEAIRMGIAPAINSQKGEEE